MRIASLCIVVCWLVGCTSREVMKIEQREMTISVPAIVDTLQGIAVGDSVVMGEVFDYTETIAESSIDVSSKNLGVIKYHRKKKIGTVSYNKNTNEFVVDVHPLEVKKQYVDTTVTVIQEESFISRFMNYIYAGALVVLLIFVIRLLK